MEDCCHLRIIVQTNLSIRCHGAPQSHSYSSYLHTLAGELCGHYGSQRHRCGLGQGPRIQNIYIYVCVCVCQAVVGWHLSVVLSQVHAHPFSCKSQLILIDNNKDPTYLKTVTLVCCRSVLFSAHGRRRLILSSQIDHIPRAAVPCDLHTFNTR